MNCISIDCECNLFIYYIFIECPNVRHQVPIGKSNEKMPPMRAHRMAGEARYEHKL